MTNASFEDLHVRLSQLLYSYNFSHPELNTLIGEYRLDVDRFSFSSRRMRASPLTPEVRRADRRRDKAMRNIPRLIKVALDSEDPQVAAAAERIRSIYSHYRSDATSQMGAQTEQIKSLIRNLTSDEYIEDARRVGLLPILTVLEQANDAFYAIYTERYNERGARPEKGLDSGRQRSLIVRKGREIFRILNGIITGINLGDQTGEEKEKLAGLIREISALFEQYRLVNAMQGRSHPQSEDEKAAAVSRELARTRHHLAELEVEHEATGARLAAKTAAEHKRLEAEAARQRALRDAALTAEEAEANRIAAVVAHEQAAEKATAAMRAPQEKPTKQ